MLFWKYFETQIKIFLIKPKFFVPPIESPLHSFFWKDMIA